MANRAVPDCLVKGYERLIKGLQLPDTNDCHVLAAAIHCNAQVIVTYNLKDFPNDILSANDIESQHPDVFLRHLIDLAPSRVLNAVKDIRS